jgi:hypothetical protein
MPGEKMHPSLLRANQHIERVRKELRDVTGEMNNFYERYMTLEDENEFLRNNLEQLMDKIDKGENCNQLVSEIRNGLNQI